MGRIASHLRAALDEEGELVQAARPTPSPEEEVEGWLGGPRRAAASTPETIAAIPMDLSVRARVSQSPEPAALQLSTKRLLTQAPSCSAYDVPTDGGFAERGGTGAQCDGVLAARGAVVHRHRRVWVGCVRPRHNTGAEYNTSSHPTDTLLSFLHSLKSNRSSRTIPFLAFALQAAPKMDVTILSYIYPMTLLQLLALPHCRYSALISLAFCSHA